MVKVKIKAKAKAVKRKFPVRIKSPEFMQFNLGESKVTDINNLAGKKVVYNLMFITKNAKHQNARVRFRITKVTSGEAETEICEYEIISYYLTRVLKRGTLVDDRFEVVSKDGKKVVFKPFVVTRGNVSREVASTIRKKVKESVIEAAGKSSAEEIYKSIIAGSLQNSVRLEVKKIYPIKFLDFRKVSLL